MSLTLFFVLNTSLSLPDILLHGGQECGNKIRHKHEVFFLIQQSPKTADLGLSENSVANDPMVLLIIIPFLNGYFIGGIPHFQTNPFVKSQEWDQQQSTVSSFYYIRLTLLVCTGCSLAISHFFKTHSWEIHISMNPWIWEWWHQ